MANTYSKIYIHIVFAVKDRGTNLPITVLPRLHAYMAEVLRKSGFYPVIIGGIHNHVHLLIELKPDQQLSAMVRELKVSSAKFINANRLCQSHFSWQRGYSAFSYSASQKENVINYIEHQFEHHKNRSLNDEIRLLYDKFGIEYDERFIFDDF